MSRKARRNSNSVLEVVISKADNQLLNLELWETIRQSLSDNFLDKISEIRKGKEKIISLQMFEGKAWRIETNKAYYSQKVIPQQFSKEVAIHIEGAYIKHILKQGTGWLYPQVSDEMYQKIKQNIIV